MKDFSKYLLLIQCFVTTVFSALPDLGQQPVNGGWGEWTENQKCSVTCGGGTKTKVRECNKPEPENLGKPCPGKAFEIISCGMNACPEWMPWTKWTECSAVCGPGTTTRSRECTVDDVPSSLCDGDNLEEKSCNEKECPINGSWSEWTQYGKCSKTCGAGSQRQRTRRCNNPEPQYGGESCSGSDTDQEECNTIDCPINGEWGEWTVETLCSTTCGEGKRILIRKCDNPPPKYNGQNCPPEDALKKLGCNLGACPNNPHWGNWSELSECSATCGSGYKSRTRSCFDNNTRVSNEHCSGQSESHVLCDLEGCTNASQSQLKLSSSMIAAICLSIFGGLFVCLAVADFMKRRAKLRNFSPLSNR